jgi:phosphate-selective porin OprO/OprP
MALRQRQRLLIGLLLFALPGLLAWAADLDTVLIRNVRLIDRDSRTEDVMVNILIKEKKLEVVTKDEIPRPEAALVVDAQGGLLLGDLHLGEPPTFLILDQDPRENVEVILDTATHARFAVHEGEIIKNRLPEATGAQPKPRKRGWLAYTPPPMTLPLSYRDDTKWNKWESRYVSGIFLAALLVDRQRWVSQDDAGRLQVGDLAEFDGGEIRGLRLGVAGTLNFKKPWVYTIFAANNAFDRGFDSDRDDDISFLDYRLDIPLGKRTSLSVGKQKEPFSMERIMSLVVLPMQERSSVSDALLPSRNVGVVLNGTGLDQRLTWSGGAFNDAIDHGQSLDESSTQFVGRATWLPFLSEDGSNLIHLGLGARYSDIKEEGRFLTEPEFNNAPIFVDTGPLAGDSVTTYSLEASWRRGPTWVAGEFLRVDVSSPALGDPDFTGYHITGSWILAGEMRSYNRRSGVFGPVPISKSVYQGGWGTWEVAARWSDLDLSDGIVDGGEMGIASLGLNWWLSPSFNVNLNYRHISLDRFDLEGSTDGLNIRVVLILD